MRQVVTTGYCYHQDKTHALVQFNDGAPIIRHNRISAEIKPNSAPVVHSIQNWEYA